LLCKNGDVVAIACGAAVPGHAAGGVAMVANCWVRAAARYPAGCCSSAVAGDRIEVDYQWLGAVATELT
jgi:2-keto-4-pentenoate hydratase